MNAGATWPAADTSTLSTVHEPAYVQAVSRFCQSLAAEHAIARLPSGDTFVCATSYEIACLGAGAAIQAVKTARVEQPVLALVRPPGHHAEPAAGMGFCVFSNAALAAHWARANAGPTLIVDFDYHHGNGTQAWMERALSEAGSPLGFISTHASPAYPGTGHFSESRLEERGFIVDIPLGLGTETDDFIAVWAALLPPLTRRLQPRTIVVSAGFDFLRDDPIAGLPVEQRAVDALCALLSDVAAAQRAPLALVLEGGYSLANMRRSGDCLARSFGKHACALHLAAAARPQDPDLAAMVSRVLAWLD